MFIDYLTLLMINLAAGTALLAYFVLKGITTEDSKPFAAGFAIVGLIAFLGAELRPGIDIVMETVRLEKKLKDVDLVITGEGKMDGQTIYGKTPFGVAKLAKKYKKPVMGICGTLGEGGEILYEHGFDAILPNLKAPMSLEEAMKESRQLTVETAERAMRILKMGHFPNFRQAPE